MMKQETGQAAGVTEPETGPVTLRDVLREVRATERAQDVEDEKRHRRDETIRRALAQGLMSKAELARQTGLSDMQIGRIERGQTNGRNRAE
jgi:ribosome-binding protein aMBF1 (putative translation factor)